MAVIHQRIKKERLRKGITQPELAKIMNISKQTVSNWENGKRTPDIDVLKKLCNFFNVSIDYLSGNTDNRNPKYNLPCETSDSDLNNSNKENILKFSNMVEQRLKEEGLYKENMSFEEKNKLANKILNFLKLLQDK